MSYNVQKEMDLPSFGNVKHTKTNNHYMSHNNSNTFAGVFKQMADMHHEEDAKPKAHKLWELVKTIEEQSEELKKNDHSELVATLVVNYSDCNKGRHPVLISREDKPIAMLIKVLEYYHSENERLKKELAAATCQ